jgi:hypothetical protein
MFEGKLRKQALQGGTLYERVVEEYQPGLQPCIEVDMLEAIKLTPKTCFRDRLDGRHIIADQA